MKTSYILIIIFIISFATINITIAEVASKTEIESRNNSVIGEQLFKKYCAACHGENRKIVANPFQGIRNYYELKWIIGFIRNNDSLLEINDPRAKYVFELNNLSVMPEYRFLTENEIVNILDYVDSFPLNKTYNDHWSIPANVMKDSVIIWENRREYIFNQQLQEFYKTFVK